MLLGLHVLRRLHEYDLSLHVTGEGRGCFPKPLAGGSSLRSTNFPPVISSARECFRAGTPGATTMVSEAFGLLPGALAKAD